ncbi:hypothetical protein EIP86_003280 [Pleurotus ostreatoroseus]|nr:hypothetical protein EIP86_003280 [Pleurotus ostreatoroseus]
MVWLEFADETLYSSYRRRFEILRWIRQNPEFQDEVARVVQKAQWNYWPQYGRLLGALHTSCRDPDWHFTVEIELDKVYKVHVHASRQDVYDILMGFDEFKREVRYIVNHTTRIWPKEAKVLGGHHVSDSDAVNHFTIKITTDYKYKIHVHATEEGVPKSEFILIPPTARSAKG